MSLLSNEFKTTKQRISWAVREERQVREGAELRHPSRTNGGSPLLPEEAAELGLNDKQPSFRAPQRGADCELAVRNDTGKSSHGTARTALEASV